MIGVVSYLVFFLVIALILGVAVLGLNLQWGFTGLFNAGVAGFMAVGGYATAILIGPSRDAVAGGFELPFVVGLAGGMAAAGAAAAIGAVPPRRPRLSHRRARPRTRARGPDRRPPVRSRRPRTRRWNRFRASAGSRGPLP